LLVPVSAAQDLGLPGSTPPGEDVLAGRVAQL
jgi:hypothetical protein